MTLVVLAIGVASAALHRDWFLVADPGGCRPPAARLAGHVLHTGAFRAPDREDSP